MADGVEYVGVEKVRSFAVETLVKEGASRKSAELVAAGLLWASLRGVDTHGIALLEHYVQDMRNGGINGDPRMKLHSTFPSFLVLDADNGFGIAAGVRAMEACVDAAGTQGVAVCVVRESTHPGPMGFFTHLAASRGMLGVAMTNTDPKMLSHGGHASFFGTNPLAIAAPRFPPPCDPRDDLPVPAREPFSLDMATTAIPFNKVMVHRRAGKRLPEGVAADEKGMPTTDPDAAALLQPSGGHKGYALAAAVEVCTAILAAHPFATFVRPMFGSKAKPGARRRIAHFFLAMRTDALETLLAQDHDDEREEGGGGGGGEDGGEGGGGGEEGGDGGGDGEEVWARRGFGERLNQMTDYARAVGDGVMLPGDPQTKALAERLEKGIPIPPETMEAFKRIGWE